jgi:hypothetical protein
LKKKEQSKNGRNHFELLNGGISSIENLYENKIFNTESSGVYLTDEGVDLYNKNHRIYNNSTYEYPTPQSIKN